MKYKYHLVVSENESEKSGENIEFDFSSHDNLLEIIEKIGKKNIFTEEEGKTFCVGLKLFSGVMLEHRTDPLFAEFSQHFGQFMKKLKAL